jgi:tripeptide aminopeptidase
MIVLSVQEEVGLVGAKAYDCESLRGKPCFVLDAAGRPGNVVIGAPYQRSFTVAVTGLAAHAGVAPQAGVSAITAAARAIAKFEWGRLDEQTTANVGKISGGTANNIVAPDCVFTGECRSQNLERLEQVQSDIEACINREIQAFGAESAISWEDNYDGFYRSPSDPLVKYCLEIATALGLPATTEVSGGGADTNVFASRGANALSLGTGMTDIHTTNETLAKSDLIDLARYVLALVVGWQKEEQ